jgi:hypothetical protein
MGQDVRGCVEQLQTVEKEIQSLETSQKELADLKDHMDGKKIERSELNLKHEVCFLVALPVQTQNQAVTACPKTTLQCP